MSVVADHPAASSTSSDSFPAATGVFDRPDMPRDCAHERVVFCQDPDTGLRAIIAVHSTVLGPALGGTRFYPYVSEQEALTDVLRLSRGMTYKAAVAGVDLGGGKAVIIGNPNAIKTPTLLGAYGRFVESLGGTYVTAGDVGTNSDDLDIIAEETAHVVGKNTTAGGTGDSGPQTALGVFLSLLAAAESTWGSDDLTGKRVGVEGAGKVGYNLVSLLREAGAEVVVSDSYPPALDRSSTSGSVATTRAVSSRSLWQAKPTVGPRSKTGTSAFRFSSATAWRRKAPVDAAAEVQHRPPRRRPDRTGNRWLRHRCERWPRTTPSTWPRCPQREAVVTSRAKTSRPT